MLVAWFAKLDAKTSSKSAKRQSAEMSGILPNDSVGNLYIYIEAMRQGRSTLLPAYVMSEAHRRFTRVSYHSLLTVYFYRFPSAAEPGRDVDDANGCPALSLMSGALLDARMLSSSDPGTRLATRCCRVGGGANGVGGGGRRPASGSGFPPACNVIACLTPSCDSLEWMRLMPVRGLVSASIRLIEVIAPLRPTPPRSACHVTRGIDVGDGTFRRRSIAVGGAESRFASIPSSLGFLCPASQRHEHSLHSAARCTRWVSSGPGPLPPASSAPQPHHLHAHGDPSQYLRCSANST